MVKIKDRVGIRYGRLIALAYIGKNQWRNAVWKCLCDCGKFVDVPGGNLQSGHTISCGCFRKETSSANVTTHGKYGTRVYKAWVHMKDRCTNKNCRRYKDWGGRGITICDRWLYSFENFFFDICTSQGLDDIPKDLTLDRINNDGNYEPGNWRFATYKEQANNRRPRNTT